MYFFSRSLKYVTVTFTANVNKTHSLFSPIAVIKFVFGCRTHISVYRVEFRVHFVRVAKCVHLSLHKYFQQTYTFYAYTEEKNLLTLVHLEVFVFSCFKICEQWLRKKVRSNKLNAFASYCSD